MPHQTFLAQVDGSPRVRPSAGAGFSRKRCSAAGGTSWLRGRPWLAPPKNRRSRNRCKSRPIPNACPTKAGPSRYSLATSTGGLGQAFVSRDALCPTGLGLRRSRHVFQLAPRFRRQLLLSRSVHTLRIRVLSDEIRPGCSGVRQPAFRRAFPAGEQGGHALLCLLQRWLG